MSDHWFFAEDGHSEDGRIRLRIKRKPKIPVTTNAGTFEDVFDAWVRCSICDGHTGLTGHRNFLAQPEEGEPRIEGAQATICYSCRVNTPGIRPYGRSASVSFRDHQIIMTASALTRAIEREAKRGRS